MTSKIRHLIPTYNIVLHPRSNFVLQKLVSLTVLIKFDYNFVRCQIFTILTGMRRHHYSTLQPVIRQWLWLRLLIWATLYRTRFYWLDQPSFNFSCIYSAAQTSLDKSRTQMVRPSYSWKTSKVSFTHRDLHRRVGI